MGIESVGNSPFVLSLSKHENDFFSSLLEAEILRLHGVYPEFIEGFQLSMTPRIFAAGVYQPFPLFYQSPLRHHRQLFSHCQTHQKRA